MNLLLLEVKIDMKGNTIMESKFFEIIEIYDEISVFRKKNSMIFFIISMLLNGINLIHLLVKSITNFNFLSLPDNISVITLYISFFLLFISVVLFDRNIKNELFNKTGVKLKKVSTYDLFLFKTSDKNSYKSSEDFIISYKYAKFILNNLDPKTKLICSIPFLPALLLPLALGLLISAMSNSLSIDYMQIANTLVWILLFYMIYWIFEKLINFKYYKFENYRKHLQFVLSERGVESISF